MPTTDTVNITKSSIWLTRLQKANQQYKAWSDKYRIPDLEAFYEGFQWNWAEGSTEDRYTSNRFFTAIDVKLPELTFSKPRFEVKPKPGKDEWDEEAAGNRAFLRTHVLNTIFSDPDIKADEEIQRAVQDAFFRFGVIEVGYSTDWIDNPNVMEPMYASHEDNSIGEEDDEIVKQPSKLPVNERIYLKQIPAANFRVGELHDPEIERCDWCAS